MVQGINKKEVNHYYTYIIVYVDDIIIMDKYSCNFIFMLMDKYNVKPSTIGESKLYLGSYIGNVDYGDG